MDLFHASDLHITWEKTCHAYAWDSWKIPLKIPFRTDEAHTRFTVEALVDWFRQRRDRGEPDWHLVITGDITDTGAREEMEEAKKILAPIWDPEILSVVPGNHDYPAKVIAAYGRSFELDVPDDYEKQRRLFRSFFGELMEPSEGFRSWFPIVKLLPKQRLALVLMDSLTEQGLYAGGVIGSRQLGLLRRVLDQLHKSPQSCEWPIVVALHHSPLDSSAKMGLEDCDQLLEACRGRVSAVINGHIHSYNIRWSGNDRGIRVFQAKATTIPSSLTPVVEFDCVPMNRYRFINGRLQDRSAVVELGIPLAPQLAARQEKWRRLYGEYFSSPHSCHACGALVAPEMIYCPWCGEETDFSDCSDLVCDNCQQPVLPAYRHCPFCGARRESAGEGTPENTGDRRCLECDRAVGRYHWYCPWCGKDLRNHPPEGSPAIACKFTNWPADPEVYLYCPWCGDPQ